MKIIIINGPNINMLGTREKEIYGEETYEDMIRYIEEKAPTSIELEFMQSNHEGDIVDTIQRAYYEDFDGIIINPAAYTHTSIAIADALRAVKIPTVEVHISDVDKRESYRKISYIEEISVAKISGKGFDGYVEAIDILSNLN